MNRKRKTKAREDRLIVYRGIIWAGITQFQSIANVSRELMTLSRDNVDG